MTINYDPKTMRFKTDSTLKQRDELIEKGRQIARKLENLDISHLPSVNYLRASQIQITTHGLVGWPHNLNLSRVPFETIKKAVDLEETMLAEAEARYDNILENFPTDVAEISLSDDNKGGKLPIVHGVEQRKREELNLLCNDRIPIHSLAELRLNIVDYNLTIRNGYRHGSTQKKFICDCNYRGLDFLEKFYEIKTKLIEVLDFTFKEKEVSTNNDN